MSDLLKLAERCEAATGPDHPGLDTDIHEAIGNCVHRETEYYAVQSDTGFTCKACRKDTYGFTIPKYSASIDAAMTLVPEGYYWTVGCDPDGIYSQVVDSKWREAECFVGGGFQHASTPALALCAAALRARSEAAAVGDGQ